MAEKLLFSSAFTMAPHLRFTFIAMHKTKFSGLNFENAQIPKPPADALEPSQPQPTQYLVREKALELKYVPNNGAWTYHIEIPDSQDIVGRWGYLKASGTIDGYPIVNKNLFTITGRNKLISINETIRKAINKTGGNTVTVTLYLTQNA